MSQKPEQKAREGELVNALAPRRPAAGEDPNARRPGFNSAVKGKRAECDGGGLGPGGRYIQRQDFTGTLTGEFYDQGDPPWRWYLLTDLTDKPDGYPFEAVWCESESLFLIHE